MVIIKGKQHKAKEPLCERAIGGSYYKDEVFKIKTQVLSEDGKTVITNKDNIIVKVKKYRKPNLKAIKLLLSKTGNWE